MYVTREKLIKFGLLAGISVLCVMIVSVILSGINQFKLGSQLASVNQVSNLSHLLVRQQANLFSMMLVRNVKSEDLVEALDAFSKEDFVVDANLYSPAGVLIAQSRNALEFKSLLQQDKAQPATQQIVEPIFSQQDLVGFLRVTFDAQYGQTTKSKVERIFHQLYGQLIILVLAGGLLASSYHYFFRRRISIVHTPVKLPLISSKTQTQRFHSKRRVFRHK
ncbi:YtjB family periplasmic protein [Actinobacillus pleuropneumoniae]|uniref:YtjB family periplasmic protein n=1 Tax=Actinobacillus pleuropneumoniae TaxID=715 RepID=A0A9Q4H7B2_ACTPL|nr:YtjB family periplasmic protein [Actinobacillus pleuropneumoniae]EFM89609.1 AphA-like protein/membrane protein affecting hemolysin expression [Actinobacillus pleuropneumoniae serovar 4 str. M62]MCL7720881.1 YtjB family periplasmic protein [Actinobacillus pleuropneumoniae]MCL7726642.1 YtjB family periplasmic protein [Actinobacillus pleuropneumoniae]MCL7729146.1 YtjB family periplasmic protein [Actinobacillus pleuropneumoniae]MCY6368152.1 YtjB family periplasmic protein [Actinobacillus pleuro